MLRSFVAAERGAHALLEAVEVRLPPSICALFALGSVAAAPSAGHALQASLGPAAACLRASLPCLLVPAFLFPAMAELPDGPSLARLACLCGVSAVLTAALTGHAASALLRSEAGGAGGGGACSVSVAAARFFAAPTTGLAAVACGVLASLAWSSLRPDDPPTNKRAPAYLGLTVLCYAAVSRLMPERARLWCPPNVGCAIALLALLSAVGGGEEVRALKVASATVPNGFCDGRVLSDQHVLFWRMAS